MNLIKIFLSATLLIMAFSMSGCQGNNSDTPESNTTDPNPLPPIDVNASKDPVTLSFVFSDEMNVTSSGEQRAVYIRAFDASGTLNTEGSITVQYPQKPDAGQFSPNTATIVDGIAQFTYTAPLDLQGRVDAGDTFSEYTFFSTTNGAVNATLRVNYTPGSSIVIGDPILQTLTLSESTINITQSEETKTLTLFAYTDQSTTDIDLSVGIQFGNTGADVGYFNPSSPSIVDGRVTFTYNGPLNLLTTSSSLATTTFTLYDKANPGITTPLVVNFVPNIPVIRVESPTVTLTKDSQAETVTVLAFDSITNKAFESGTILVEYPTAITNGSVSGGTFTQNEATIVNGKAVFSFNGPTPLTQIANQTFTFKYKENQTVSTNLTMQYSPTLPSIASLAINEASTTISKDKQIHKVVINAIDTNGDFVASGTINVKFPAAISNGTDVGSFTEFSVDVVNGQATFEYSGPSSVLSTSLILANAVFEFSDAAGIASTVNWTVAYNPEVPVIRLSNSSITITEDSESVVVHVLGFDENNQSLNAGTISVAYPTEIVNQNANAGRFLENEAEISNGEALFTFSGPETLENISDLIFTFSYKGNVLVPTKDLTVSYTPPTATVILNKITEEVTLNSQTVNIDVDVRDAFNNPFPTGSVKVVYPEDVKTGRDIGVFISSEIELVNGIASFVYTAPKNLDANTSDIVFEFYHDSLPTTTKTFTITLNPEPNQVILTDYFLTTSYADGNITMDLESTKLITFYVKDKDENLLGDTNITTIDVSVLNIALADLSDTNASAVPADIKQLTKNSASLSILSNTVSGVVPIKVVATFKGVNNEDVVLTEVFNVVVVSGPPTAMSISYVSSTNDTDNSKFIDKMVVSITDKYSNRVNNNPGLSVALIAGYTSDTSGPLGYMYHPSGATIDTTDDKIKVPSGAVMQTTITNAIQAIVTDTGSNYAVAPTVSANIDMGVGSGFAATAYLSSFGGVSSVNLIAGGKEYVNPPVVSGEGSGVGFSATAVLSTTGTFFTTESSLTTGLPIINLDNPGSGYTSVPLVSVTTPNGGTNFDAVAVLESTGSIKSVVVANGGTGYTVGDTFDINGGTSGSVKVLTVTGGVINTVTIANAGTGYSSPIVDTFSGGTGAVINATVGYEIKEIQLRNGGTGYDNEDITVAPGTSTVTALASSKIGYSVASVTVNAMGSGYRSAEIIFTDEEDGEGALASSTIKYPVSNIEITNNGTGYNNGTLDLTPVGGDTGTGATAIGTVFADFSTVVENSGVNDEFLMTFGQGYSYNASGKWDITSTGANDNFERVLTDQYEGITTAGLGFAVGSNFRQDVCINAQEWVATATTPVAEFDSNGLAEIDITYDYYLAAKDVVLSANLVGAQNSVGEIVKIGEATKHTLRGTGLIADTLSLPAGLDHSIYRIQVELDGALDTFRNVNFTYTVSTTSLGLTIHRVNDSMDDGIHSCPVNNDQGRAYVEVEVSTTLPSSITLDNLVISREFK